MLVKDALNVMTSIINKAQEEYKENPDNQIKNDDGNVTGYKYSPLLLISDDDKCFQLGISLINIALQTIPISLLEDKSTSTASELKIVSDTKFVRVPNKPDCSSDTANLDIDDALAYAVIFDALANLWSGFNEFAQKASLIVMNYNNTYKGILPKILGEESGSGSAEASLVLVRFSQDGENWHDNYQDGDIYISFKRVDTGDWTPAIKFVGDDGSCKDLEFTALKDTPASYSGNKGKFIAVNDDENGLIFTDPPTSSGSGNGATKFTDLGDTPDAYASNSGDAGKFVRVNSNGDGLVFETANLTDLADTPSSYTGNKGKILAVNDSEDGIDFIDPQNSSSGNGVFYSEDTGTIELDGFTYTKFLIYPQDNGDITLTWKKDGNDEYGVTGQIYEVAVILYNDTDNNADNSATFDDDGGNIIYDGDVTFEKGSASDNTNTTYTLVRLMYIGAGEFVQCGRVVQTDIG